MVEIPKWVGDSSPLSFSSGFEEMGIQKIAISDRDECSMKKTETSDSFFVDIESLSHGTDKDITANSRISVKLQRNLSRKGSQRGERNKTSLPSGGGAVNGDAADGSLNASMTSACNPDKTIRAKEEEKVISTESQLSITITTENRCRRFGKQRNYTWFMDPRRVLFFFASLSSMGTILLIYFTLSVAKFSGDGSTHSQ